MAKTFELYEDLKRANETVKEALKFEHTIPYRESLTQRFEYTFELSWKLMNSILFDQGIDVNGTRTIIREAGKLSLIDSVEKWFEYLESRNRTVHMYKQDIAEEIEKVIREGFFESVEYLIQNSKKYIYE
ncbi:MAG: HI0074 family nucleotidyltransferase substrate-binding subunit [bacterium]